MTAASRPEPAAPRRDAGPSVLASTGSMAIATLISRVTGFVKILLMAAVLGPATASAFQVSNTLPNLISELVLGAVLTAIVIPVLVRAEREDADGGTAFVRRLLTAALTIFTVAMVASVAAAPWLTRLMLTSHAKVDVPLATALAYLLLPQILFYGAAGLFTAILNTRKVFKPGAWAPVLNNVVAIATLMAYYLMPGKVSLNPVQMGEPKLLVLGIGTTLGVVVQAAVLIPYLRKNRIDMRPLWGIDPRLKKFAGMAVAIVVYVMISQAGLVVTNRIAGDADAGGPAIYSFVWMLLQVPYGILGVTLLTAVMPELSHKAAAGDDRGVVADLTMATKLTLVALIPVVGYFSVAGPTVGTALFNYGNFGAREADLLGFTLSASAFTLIPYAIVLLHLRVFYAREEAWTPTLIIIGITAVRIALSYTAPLLVPDEYVVVLLAIANGLGFVVGMGVGIALLRRHLGPLGTRSILVMAGKTVIATAVGVAAMMLVRLAVGPLLGFGFGMPSWVALLDVLLSGAVMIAVTAVVLVRLKVSEALQVRDALARVAGRFIPALAVDPPADPDDRLRDDRYGVEPMGRGTPVQPPMVPYSETDPFSYVPLLPRVDAALRTMHMSDSHPYPGGAEHDPHTGADRPRRSPRLIPGAMIAGGRYRLLARHGGLAGLQFWQAFDTRLEREVALTFVNAPDPAERSRSGRTTEDTAEILTRTLRLGRLNSPGVARVLDVIRGSSGGIVVSEWTEGSSLAEISAMLPPTAGAARAVRSLAAAAEDAHRIGTALGIDHPDRIRISADGAAVLAFPAVLAGADQTSDVRGLGAVLYALLTDEWPLPGPDEPEDGVADSVGGLHRAPTGPQGLPVEPHTANERIPFEISAVAMRALQDNSGIRTAATVQHVLGQLGTDSDSDSVSAAAETMMIEPVRLAALDDEPDPDRRRKMTIALSALGVAVVVVLVIIVGFLTDFFGGSSSAPLPEELRDKGITVQDEADDDEEEAEAAAEPEEEAPATVPVTAASVSVYSPMGSPDQPATAPLAIDGDPGTMWSTDQYWQQLPQLKNGVGLLASFDDAAEFDEVIVDSPTPGTEIEIRSAPSPDATLDQMSVLGRATVGEGPTAIEIDQDQPNRFILVWISKLGGEEGAYQSSVSEITFLARE